MAIIVTFSVTYSLILPAITVSRDQAYEIAGLYLDDAEEVFDIVEDNGDEDELWSSESDVIQHTGVLEDDWDGILIEEETEAETTAETEAENTAETEPDIDIMAQSEVVSETEEETEIYTELGVETESEDGEVFTIRVTVTEKTTGSYATTGTIYDTVTESEDFVDADDVDRNAFTVSRVVEDGTIVFTNTRKTRTVIVKKMFEDPEDNTEAAFTAALQNGANAIRGYQVYPGTEGEGVLTTDESGKVCFNLKHNETQALTVPYGTKLVIAETAEGYTAQIATANEAQDEDTTENSFTMTVTVDDTVTFTNRQGGVNVVLKKVGADSASQTVIADHLGGAEFTVYMEDGTTVAEGKVEGVSTTLSNLTSSAADGVFFNGVLAVGTYYLRETDAPAGYYKPAEDLKITVAADGKVTLYAQSSNTSTVHTPGEESGNSGKTTWVTVKNYSGYALPSTGGPGTHLIYLLGIIFTSLSGTGLLMKRRRRNAA